MPAVLLDTNAIRDLMRDHPVVKAYGDNHPDPVRTSVVSHGEIFFGLNRLPQGKKRTDLEARAKRALSRMPLESLTEPIAEEYGRLKALLQLQGANLDDNDLWIAATALSRNYTSSHVTAF